MTPPKEEHSTREKCAILMTAFIILLLLTYFAKYSHDTKAIPKRDIPARRVPYATTHIRCINGSVYHRSNDIVTCAKDDN